MSEDKSFLSEQNDKDLSDTSVLKALAEDYPQLYLDPDKDTQDTYKNVILRGSMPENKSLDHYAGDNFDRSEIVDTPAGKVRVVTLGSRKDFELVVRGLMAAKNGPSKEVPASQGAGMFTVFNWPRINSHLEGFSEEERSAEFKRFTSVRENYIDMLVVLSRGPYSNVDARVAGCGEEEWLELSDTIRRYHELTHVICRRKYPEDIDAIRDELVADAVGLLAAYGSFDPKIEKLFLGITDEEYTGGRLGNYTDEPEKISAKVCEALDRIKNIVDEKKRTEPFELIPELMKAGGNYQGNEKLCNTQI